jgi:Zn finger protein HypA/HybF involved in hydrogenase expression
MFICNDCTGVFEYPKLYIECIGECWGTTVYETLPICPYCGSDDIDVDEYQEGEMIAE